MSNRKLLLAVACALALLVSGNVWAADSSVSLPSEWFHGQPYALTPEVLQTAFLQCETLLARLGGLCLDLLTLRGPSEARIDATIARLYDQCGAMEADAIALIDRLDNAETAEGSSLSARLEFVRSVADSMKWAVRGAENGLWAAEHREWDHAELWTWHVMERRDHVASLLALYEVIAGGH